MFSYSWRLNTIKLMVVGYRGEPDDKCSKMASAGGFYSQRWNGSNSDKLQTRQHPHVILARLSSTRLTVLTGDVDLMLQHYRTSTRMKIPRGISTVNSTSGIRALLYSSDCRSAIYLLSINYRRFFFLQCLSLTQVVLQSPPKPFTVQFSQLVTRYAILIYCLLS